MGEEDFPEEVLSVLLDVVHHLDELLHFLADVVVVGSVLAQTQDGVGVKGVIGLVIVQLPLFEVLHIVLPPLLFLRHQGHLHCVWAARALLHLLLLSRLHQFREDEDYHIVEPLDGRC